MNGDELDVAAGRCCPNCRTMLTEHNVAVWNAGYSVGARHTHEDIAAAEQRGREDNTEHAQCIVHGSKAHDALMDRLARAEEVVARVEALAKDVIGTFEADLSNPMTDRAQGLWDGAMATANDVLAALDREEVS